MIIDLPISPVSMVSMVIALYIAAIGALWAQPGGPAVVPPKWSVQPAPAPVLTPTPVATSPLGQPRPIAPGYCPPGTLPQYCAIQAGGGVNIPGVPPAVAPFNCPLGNVQCMQLKQNQMALGCSGGPYQNMCLQRQQGMPGLMGRPIQYAMLNPQQQQKRKQDQNQALMPLLNALTSILGGGGGGAEPAFEGGERMAMTDSSGNTTGYAGPDVHPQNLRSNSGRGVAPVVEPFKHYFQRCTESLGLGTCSFKNLGVWGDKAHQATRSCHNSGEAIDVGLPFNCSQGGSFDANDPRAMQVAVCMATNADERFGVIFKDQTPARNMFPGGQRGRHNGHMHIQLKECGRGR